MDLLRLLTCGSVDDGKSTLIGRLLHDSQLIYEDVLAGLAADSATHGSAGDQVDLALLMDGLRAEREQGITIDVGVPLLLHGSAHVSSSPTPPGTPSTRATWRPAPRPATSRSS